MWGTGFKMFVNSQNVELPNSAKVTFRKQDIICPAISVPGVWHLPASGQPCASSGTSPVAELLSALQQGILVTKIRGSTMAEPLLPTTELPSSVEVVAFNTFTGVPTTAQAGAG